MSRRSRRGTGLQRSKARAGVSLASPGLLGIVLITLVPLALGVVFSFYEYDLIRPPTFVGLANYTSTLSDPVFWVTAGNTLYFAVTQVALGTVVALLVALLLSQAMPGNGVMRTIVYLPQAMSYVVVALIWNLLYDPLNGPINGLLEALSLGPVNFLTDSHLAMPSIIAMSIWRNLGYFMIILLAGIQSVSTEMLEAAQMDGAGAVQRFFHITIPQLSNTLLFVVVTWFLGGLQMFTQSYVMTDGGPVNATRTLVFQMYDAAFKAGSIGEATAISVMMFSAVVVVSILLRAAQSLRTTRMEEA
ncbi:Glycerol-3-phosphate ABC transporter, permease protein UgpA (TC 3.A.1.1.3) [Brachybacterium faecium]|nr:Glycerol-3-phosphate ABC transporter, permease protein UgpA (TC 3.A.1.1.3) [Brachybacterium faecium]